MMHRKWQYHLLTMLRHNVSDPAIEQDIDRAWKEYPKGFVAYLQPGDVPPGRTGAGPVSGQVRRLPAHLRATDRAVRWHRPSVTGIGTTRPRPSSTKRFPVLRFIGRMVQHILPKGFQRIRYYGLHGHVRYEKMRQHLTQVLPPTNTPPDPKGYRVVPRSPFAELFRKSFGKDPLICPRCGDHMELEFVYHPDYGILTEYELFGKEQSLGRDEPAALVDGKTQGQALGSPERMGQIPLPFM